MRSSPGRVRPRFQISPLPLALWSVGGLVVVYIGLIAVVMSYAALTIEFAESVRNDEASVAALEGEYLRAVADIMATDYAAHNYVPPVAKTFVKATNVTALR